MSIAEVTKLLGQPTDKSMKRSLVPFSRKGRMTYYYKGQGQVIFDVDDFETQANARVRQVVPDPNESGKAP